MTFRQHVRRSKLANHPGSQEQNQKVIQKSDQRNKARNELNRAEQITCTAGCHALCVPARAGMPKYKIENMRFFVDTLRLLLPIDHGRPLRSYLSGAWPGQE